MESFQNYLSSYISSQSFSKGLEKSINATFYDYKPYSPGGQEYCFEAYCLGSSPPYSIPDEVIDRLASFAGIWTKRFYKVFVTYYDELQYTCFRFEQNGLCLYHNITDELLFNIVKNCSITVEEEKARKEFKLLSQRLPAVNERVDCPACGFHPASKLWYVIQHLNDLHRWTRESIADWIRTLPFDTTFKNPNIDKA